MQYHRGRLLDHVHLRVANLEASKKFYSAVFESLGFTDVLQEGPDHFFADELFVDKADGYVSQVHIAFQAKNQKAVQSFYKAALNAGGKDNGEPGERPYHPGYYGAFVLDPDGNNIEAVYHGPFERSAESVVIKPAN